MRHTSHGARQPGRDLRSGRPAPRGAHRGGRRRRAVPARQDRRRRRSDRRRRDADRVRVARRRSASSASASARTRSTSAATTSRTTSPTGPGRRRTTAIARPATIPPQGFRTRDDATYYPVPWLLSSRGYGVLIDRDETSTFHLATDPKNAWSAEVQSHAIALRVFGGPTLAQVLRRFTAATGRQPPPGTAVAVRAVVPDRPAEHRPARGRGGVPVASCSKADAPVSAAETQLRYLPVRAGPRQRGLRGRAREVLPRARAGDPHVRQPDALLVLRAAVRTRRSPPARCRRPRPARRRRSTRSSVAPDRPGSRSSPSRSSTSPPTPGSTSTAAS